MGGGDYSVVYGCSNDSRKPEKAIVIDHVGKRRWYGPKYQKDILKWQKLLNRGGDFKVSMSTKVCSNHFAAGYRSDHCTTPTLYLKGYPYPQEIKKRKSPSKRKLLAVSSPPPPKRARNIKRDGSDNVSSVFIVEQNGDHIFEVEEKTLAPRCTPVTACNHCIKLNSNVIDFKKMLHEKEKELEKLKSELEGSKIQKKEQSNPVLSYSQVEDNDKMLYTGMQNKNVFEWIMNKIKDKIQKLQYGELVYLNKILHLDLVSLKPLIQGY